MFGLWSGMIIGFITEYYTNNAYEPTLHLSEACENGPAPNIILGLALGYGSVVVPILALLPLLDTPSLMQACTVSAFQL